MKRFAAGMALGILLGAAASGAAQWSQVGVYRAEDLAKAPAYILVYGAGVYDSLVAQSYHATGGGLGQAHLDRARACLRQRVYGGAEFTRWARAVFAAEPPRWAAMLLIDRACQGAAP